MKTAVPRCNSKTAHCCTYYDWRGRNEGWGGGDGEGWGRWVEGWKNKNRKIWKIMTAQIPTSGRTCTFKGVCDLASVERSPETPLHAFFCFCQYNILFLSPWMCSYMLVLLWSRHVHREVWGCIHLISLRFMHTFVLQNSPHPPRICQRFCSFNPSTSPSIHQWAHHSPVSLWPEHERKVVSLRVDSYSSSSLRCGKALEKKQTGTFPSNLVASLFISVDFLSYSFVNPVSKNKPIS